MIRHTRAFFVLILAAALFIGQTVVIADESPAEIKAYLALQKKLEELTIRRNQLLAQAQKLREAKKDYAPAPTDDAAKTTESVKK